MPGSRRDGAPSPRSPQTPLDVLNRFRRTLSKQQFQGLGPAGKGVLTISGGLAVFPYDARDMEELIAKADQQLMMRAKRCGKDSIFLVGSGEQLEHEP